MSFYEIAVEGFLEDGGAGGMRSLWAVKVVAAGPTLNLTITSLIPELDGKVSVYDNGIWMIMTAGTWASFGRTVG